MAPLQLEGCTGTPTLSSTTTPSGASVLQVRFALWHSTSASGPNRRVPPPRGSPPRCPSRAFPSSSVSSSLLSLYEAFLIPRFVASWPSSGVVHSPFFFGYVFFFAVLYARQVPLPVQTDVFPVCGRLHLLPSCSVSPHSCVCVPRCLSVQERSDVFPDRVRVRGHIHFLVSLPFHCSRVCGSHVVRRSTCVVRLVSVEQLTWTGQVGRLPSYVQDIRLSQIRGLAVLAVSDSVDFKLTLRSACLEG